MLGIATRRASSRAFQRALSTDQNTTFVGVDTIIVRIILINITTQMAHADNVAKRYLDGKPGPRRRGCQAEL
jgi:hypothetical protein